MKKAPNHYFSTMQIIPAIFIKEGKPAVFSPGEFEDIQFLSEDPYELIQRIGNMGIQRIHLIDADASLPGGIHNHGLIGSLVNTCVVDIEVGGGINTLDFIHGLQHAGVDYFVLGSVVIDNFPFVEELLQKQHLTSDHVLIAVDVFQGKLFTHGWTEPVPELTVTELIDKCVSVGYKRFFVTDLEPDGEQNGPRFPFYEELIQRYPDISIGAAGRIHTFEQIERLEKIGLKEVLVGDRVYKEKGLLETVAKFNKERGR